MNINFFSVIKKKKKKKIPVLIGFVRNRNLFLILISIQVYINFFSIIKRISKDSSFNILCKEEKSLLKTDFEVVQLVKKRKKYSPTNSNINYRREMKHAPINMNCCLLQFDALKFVLRARLHGSLYLTLIFLV